MMVLVVWMKPQQRGGELFFILTLIKILWVLHHMWVGPCGFAIIAGYGGLDILKKNISRKLEPDTNWIFEANTKSVM